MSNLQTVNTNLAKTEPTSLVKMIEKSVKELGRALPDHLKPERMVRIALTCIRTNPDLSRCTPESFLGALFTAAQLGVEPIAGRAYILPFNNNRKKPDGSWHSVKEAQFILGYRGVADLFFRNEKSVNLAWGSVRPGDEFDYEYGTDAHLRHKPALAAQPGIQVTHYYVMATLANGGKPFMVMSREECLGHGRHHSKTFDRKKGEFFESSPWRTSEESMCLKTVLVQLAKILPLSVELQRAIQADETSREFRKEIADNILDIPSETDWNQVEAETKERTDKLSAGVSQEKGDAQE